MSARLHAMPFTPVCFSEFTELPDLESILAKYQIPKRYFLISNQLWLHKDHETAIRAFSIAFKDDATIALVCTGQMNDSRAPDLASRLKSLASTLNIDSQVFFLGRIPKLEQLQLMNHAIAVVQPTLFEGGPGGGQSYEAIALGTPVLATDIRVNREMTGGIVQFFPPKDYLRLAALMQDCLSTCLPRTQGLSDRRRQEQSRLTYLRQILIEVCVRSISRS
jgi:glycosyltransferase involved in cell wall biosynthesis